MVEVIEGVKGRKCEIEEEGGRLLIRFRCSERRPSGWLKSYLRAKGYERYEGRGDAMIGDRDIEDVKARLWRWARDTRLNHGHETGTLCWDCARAYGGCSWSKSFKPVEGWEAERDERALKWGCNNTKRTYVSYTVKECPEFELEERMLLKIKYERRVYGKSGRKEAIVAP